jgi:hypothetical protein
LRRLVTYALVGVGLSLSLASEGLTATSDPNATAPSQVSRGESFLFTIRNCSPQNTDQEAWIYFQSTNSPVEPVPIEQEAEGDGVSDIPHSYSTTGVKNVLVRCTLETALDELTTWQEALSVSVVEGTTAGQSGPSLTAAERKKCKKIDNAAKRKRCLKKQAAD